jgi:hypothetical protein
MTEEYWAWRCEECLRWQHPDRQHYGVIVRDIGSEVTSMDSLERLWVKRKMTICATCWNSMRVTDPGLREFPPNPVRPSR